MICSKMLEIVLVHECPGVGHRGGYSEEEGSAFSDPSLGMGREPTHMPVELSITGQSSGL